jgi:Domain of unknown function (DUF4282)
MAKTCPSCGFVTPDDQAVYCNKCGYPFPKGSSIKPPVTKIAGAPPARRAAAPRPAPQPASRPVRRRAARGGFFSFGTLIGKEYGKEIYILGVVIIILASIMGIAGMFAKPVKGAAANVSFTNTTAIAQDPAGSPLFWILFLIIGNVLWRLFCELCVVVFRLDDALGHGGGAVPDEDEPEYAEEMAADHDDYWSMQNVQCPHCGKVVPASDLRECEHCGVQGCSSCIRMMGLLKKTMTCRACFEGE